MRSHLKVLSFFGLEIEVWRISDSPPAPKFNIVAKPNDWTRSEKTRAQGLTPNKQMQLDFWLGFREYILDNNLSLKPGNPQPVNYMNFSLGRSGFWLAAIASLFDTAGGGYDRQELRAELGTNHSHSDYYYDQLVTHKSDIENGMECDLTWHNPGKDYRVRKLYVQLSTELEDSGARTGQYAWLVQNLEKLRKVYEKHLKDIEDPPENYQSKFTPG